MKNIIVFFVFCWSMTAALNFARVSEAAEEAPIYIGWSCKDITPDRPVSLQGQYYQRISQYVQSPLKVTALALESRTETERTNRL